MDADLARRPLTEITLIYAASFFSQLSEPVQAFVRQVEECANMNIEVILSARLNGSGPSGHGRLEVVINAQCVQLFAPTDGYFPERAFVTKCCMCNDFMLMEFQSLL